MVSHLQVFLQNLEQFLLHHICPMWRVLTLILTAASPYNMFHNSRSSTFSNHSHKDSMGPFCVECQHFLQSRIWVKGTSFGIRNWIRCRRFISKVVITSVFQNDICLLLEASGFEVIRHSLDKYVLRLYTASRSTSAMFKRILLSHKILTE